MDLPVGSGNIFLSAQTTHLGGRAVPVRWWHGDSDPFVPLAQAQQGAALLPDVKLIVRPGESHLGGFAAADDVLGSLARIWQDKSPA